MRLECKIEYKLEDFDLKLAMESEGEIFGISGPSGSGKSTFLDILCGLRKPEKGEIILDGKTLFSSDERINIATRKREMGYMFQQGNLFPHQTVWGNLQMGIRISHRREQSVDLEEICRMLEIDHLLKRFPSTLSGGERQRVALGRALAASPRLLLLDEPFNALDKERKEGLIRYLLTINKTWGIPVMLVSHDNDDLEKMSDTLLFLRQGRILSMLEQVKSRSDVRRRNGS